MNEAPLVIPEDLKELYRASTNYEFIGYSVTTSLIERIALREQQNKMLREALEGILAITDRKHVVWDKARAALKATEEK